MDKVRVFVSSTCYDLSQIRRDLESSFIEMDYEPIMSDSSSLAIPEGLDKIEACKWMVRNSDIFVMVIGGRYGNTEAVSGKSIVSIEYETAVSAKIPIYVFVDDEVWSKRDAYIKLIEMVEAKEIDLAKVKSVLGEKIQDPRIFELIEQINKDGKWINSFKIASDIIKQLKKNWSLEFKTLLKLKVDKIRYDERLDKSKPVLRVAWTLNGTVLKKLQLKSPQGIDKEILIKEYNRMMISEEDLKKIQEQEDKLSLILKNINYKKLGFQNESQDLDNILQLPNQFNSLLKHTLERINTDFEEFTLNTNIRNRIIKPNFQISNEGDVPAQDVVIFINIPKGIGVINEDDVPIVIGKRFADINILFNILKNIDAWYQEAVEIINKPMLGEISSDTLLSRQWGYTNYPSTWLGGGETKTYFDSVKIKDVFLEETGIRINMNPSKLKHGFSYRQNSPLVFYSLSTKLKGNITLPYSCFADNLRRPDNGELVVEII